MNRNLVTLALLALASVSLLFSTAILADDLALAKKSGCMACHSIDKKIVGPAWKDVAAKYKGTKGAKAMLISKVKPNNSSLINQRNHLIINKLYKIKVKTTTKYYIISN